MKTFCITCCLSIASLVFAVTADAKRIDIIPPVMGWSSWNTYRVNISDTLIQKQADAMIALGLNKLGYKYINIDDGFFGYRDERGRLHVNPTRFPNGMKPVADYIHALGLKAGIYSEAGANTCGSIWDADKSGIGVGLYGYERQDADLFFNQWGFDFIKIDYCGAGQQLELDERERYTAIVEAINDVSSKKIAINICRWAYPGTWVRELANSWRISGDISPHWNSIKNIISKNLYLSAFAGDGHYNDMDMLELGRGLKPEEEETHFGMWCIMSSPLMIGCDLTTIPSSTLSLLKNDELIALNQDCLGLQAYVAMRANGGYVLVKDIKEERGLTRAVALYNPTDSVCHFRVPLSVLEFEGKTKVRDLLKRKDESPVRDSIVYDVQAHGVKILNLQGTKRIERTVYEAEQAYLNQFDDLARRKRGVCFAPFDSASGGVVVTNLGGHKENYALWEDVYSENGGDYEMTLYYLPSDKKKSMLKNREVDDRCLEVTVNGERYVLKELQTERAKSVQEVSLKIKLKKGYNAIKIGSRYTWTPDLDCFVIEPLKN